MSRFAKQVLTTGLRSFRTSHINTSSTSFIRTFATVTPTTSKSSSSSHVSTPTPSVTPSSPSPSTSTPADLHAKLLKDPIIPHEIKTYLDFVFTEKPIPDEVVKAHKEICPTLSEGRLLRVYFLLVSYLHQVPQEKLETLTKLGGLDIQKAIKDRRKAYGGDRLFQLSQDELETYLGAHTKAPIRNSDWYVALETNPKPTVVDIEKTTAHVVSLVLAQDQMLTSKYPDFYIRRAHLSPIRAALYSELNALINRIAKKHNTVFPTIVAAPLRREDVVTDENSPDYDENAIGDAEVWADFRPEELISATAIQNERTGLYEGKWRGEDVVFPETAPTLEWVTTTPVDLHLFEEPPIIKCHEDEVLD